MKVDNSEKKMVPRLVEWFTRIQKTLLSGTNGEGRRKGLCVEGSRKMLIA